MKFASRRIRGPGRTSGPLVVSACVVAALGLAAPPLAGGLVAQTSWEDDDFARAILGTWRGEGEVYGSSVTLEREWGLDLAARYLRADMRVEMANGQGFRALSYWRRVERDRYEVIWMDELGETTTFVAERTADPHQVSSEYVDTTSGPEPEPRRLVFHIVGRDTYVETMYAETGAGWSQIAKFSFTRVTR